MTMKDITIIEMTIEELIMKDITMIEVTTLYYK
jgi:hypothetical protein